MKFLNVIIFLLLTSINGYSDSPRQMYENAKKLVEVGEFEKALIFYEKSCEGGIAEGCRYAGALYDMGMGVKANVDIALKYYELGCNLNDGDSCMNAASIYTIGTHSEDLQAEYKKALELNEKACNLNVGMACRSLALAYETGLDVEKNLEKALSIYEKGCKLNAKLACDDYNKLKNKMKK